jgi:biotin carboxyl carrier protein
VKIHARLRRGSDTSEHEVELLAHESSSGVRRVRIDNRTVEADCEQIAPGVYSLLLEGKSYEAYVSKHSGDGSGRNETYVISVGRQQYTVEFTDPRRWRRRGSSLENEGPQEIVAPMPGKIVRILVTEGQEVDRDQGLLIIEAMKMQNELRSPRAGSIERVFVPEGRGVEAGAKLVRLV